MAYYKLMEVEGEDIILIIRNGVKGHGLTENGSDELAAFVQHCDLELDDMPEEDGDMLEVFGNLIVFPDEALIALKTLGYPKRQEPQKPYPY